MLVGSAAKVWSLVWPKDLQCKCLVLFRVFVGPCGPHSEVVVPRIAHGVGDVWCGLGGLLALVGFAVCGLIVNIAQGPMV